MVEREREVDEDLVRGVLGLVVFLDDVVYVLRAQAQRLSAAECNSMNGLTVTAELTKSEKMKAARSMLGGAPL